MTQKKSSKSGKTTKNKQILKGQKDPVRSKKTAIKGRTIRTNRKLPAKLPAAAIAKMGEVIDLNKLTEEQQISTLRSPIETASQYNAVASKGPKDPFDGCMVVGDK